MDLDIFNWSADSGLEPLQPLSPSLFEDDDPVDTIVLQNLSRNEMAGKLLDHLDELHGEEEPELYCDWCSDEKSVPLPNLTIFDGLPPSPPSNYTESAAASPYYENSPQPSLPPAVYYQPYEYQPPVVPSWPKEETLTPPESPKVEDDILKLLQEIEPDELKQVLDKVDNLKEAVKHDDSDYSVASPFLSSDSGLDDPEWSPRRSAEGAGLKRKHPYRTATEEKRQRKKEQNKNAATRYRQKKKAEVEVILSEEKQLENKNKGLKEQLEEISREVKYLKSLMRDVYRAKGLIK